MALFLLTHVACEGEGGKRPCLSFEVYSLIKKNKKAGYTVCATLDKTCDGVLSLMENRTKNPDGWLVARRLGARRMVRHSTNRYTIKRNGALVDGRCYCLRFENKDDDAPYFSNAFIKKGDKFEPIVLEMPEDGGKEEEKGEKDAESGGGRRKFLDGTGIIFIALGVFVMIMIIVIIAINM